MSATRAQGLVAVTLWTRVFYSVWNSNMHVGREGRKGILDGGRAQAKAEQRDPRFTQPAGEFGVRGGSAGTGPHTDSCLVMLKAENSLSGHFSRHSPSPSHTDLGPAAYCCEPLGCFLSSPEPQPLALSNANDNGPRLSSYGRLGELSERIHVRVFVQGFGPR